MNLIISNSSEIPIYEQLKIQIVKSIVNNDLKSNEMLPSIRNLAKDLRISVLTVKKSYDELEKEGYITTVHGKGSYVKQKNNNLIKETQIKEIENHIEEIIKISKNGNISKKEILDIFEYLYKGEN